MVGGRHRVDLARTIDRLGRKKNLRQVALVGAGIHAQRTTDRAGNAAQELESGQRMIAGRQRDVEIERARAGHDLVAFDRDAGETAHQADDHAASRRRRAREGWSRLPAP